VTSPEKRCGKSTVLQLLLGLVPRAIPAVNLTSASVFRVVESYRPTLLVDEGDSFLAGREDLRGILNSGHCRRMAFVPRCAGDTHEPRLFSTWAPKAIALIGKLADRSIEIRMRRRATGEKVDRVRAQLLDRHIPLQRKAWPFVVHDLGQYRWMRASSGLAL